MFFSSLSSSFSPVSLLRIAFRTPSSLVGCSDFSSSSVGVFSLLLALPFLSFIFLICLSFFRSFCFRLPAFYFCLSVVLFYRTVCRYMRLSFFSYPLLALLLLLRSFTAFLAIRCYVRLFSWVSVLSQLSSSILSNHDSIPLLVCAHFFRLLLPHFR